MDGNTSQIARDVLVALNFRSTLYAGRSALESPPTFLVSASPYGSDTLLVEIWLAASYFEAAASLLTTIRQFT